MYGADGSIGCEERALTWIMIYTAPWIFLFFGLVYPALMDTKSGSSATEATSNESEGEDAEQGSTCSRLWGILQPAMNSNSIATLIGIAVGLVRPLQTEMFDGGLIWFSSSCKTLGTPVVGLSALIVGATLGQTVHRLAKSNSTCGKLCCLCFGSTTPTADALDGAGSSSSEEVQQYIDGAAAGAANSSAEEEYAGFNSGEGGGGAADAPAKAPLTNPGAAASSDVAEVDAIPNIWIIILFVAIRMIVCPVVCCAIVWGVSDALITSADPADVQLIKLVLFLEASVPSADFVIVTCQRAGRVTAAQTLSVAYLMEYLLGILTLTLSVGFAMGWIYDDAAALVGNHTNNSVHWDISYNSSGSGDMCPCADIP